MIYGSRIKQARELSGLTQKALALKIGVSQSTIARIEVEHLAPTRQLLEMIAGETNVRPGFFERPPFGDFSFGSLLYRARVALTAVERDKAYQFARLSVEQLQRMAEQLELPKMVLPKPTEDAKQDARMARVTFGIPSDQPLFNLVNVLERHGIIVIALPFSLEKMDAFSTWVVLDEERPVIALSAGKPGDRLRFNVAHELGHIVRHRGLRGPSASAEHEADEFAAELLMPEAALRSVIPDQLTLTYAARLKPRWGVSLQAIVRKAYDAGIINNRRYRYLFEQIGRLGYRLREPSSLDIPVEKPRAFKQMAELVYGPLFAVDGVAKEAEVLLPLSHAILEQYANALGNSYPTDVEEYRYLPGHESRN